MLLLCTAFYTNDVFLGVPSKLFLAMYAFALQNMNLFCIFCILMEDVKKIISDWQGQTDRQTER